MSIVITSGVAKGASNVRRTVNKAILRGLRRGIITALDEFLPTVALKTGALRRAFLKAIRDVLGRFSVLSFKKLVISWAEIKRLTILLVDYAEWHFVPESKKLFYFEPTTARTRPINFAVFKPIALGEVYQAITQELRVAGIKQKARFTVS